MRAGVSEEEGESGVGGRVGRGVGAVEERMQERIASWEAVHAKSRVGV